MACGHVMCSHVPTKDEHMVRYYGYYSNLCIGKRKASSSILLLKKQVPILCYASLQPSFRFRL